jgi:molybdopterin synthase sulfur carrier subunit
MEWKLFADLAEVAGDRHVEVDLGADATVRDAFEALLADRPPLRDRVLDEEGDLREHINVLRNGHNVFTEQDGWETALAEGDELALFPPVSGG